MTQTKNTMQLLKSHQLPPELIGEMASFLKMKEYLWFQRSNRNIYIGCNSPVKLQSFIFNGIASCKINWTKFSMIRSLAIHSSNFIESLQSFDGKISFSNLETLELFAIDNFTNNSFDSLLQIKSINFSRVNKLILRYIGGEGTEPDQDSPLSTEHFLKFLFAFSNLKCLICQFVELDDYDYSNEDEANLLTSLPHIEAFCSLSASTTHFGSTIIELFGNKLKALEVSHPIDGVPVKLMNLQELIVVSPSSDSFDVIGSTNKLKKVEIHQQVLDESDDIKAKVISLLENQLNLEYIKFSIRYMSGDDFRNLSEWVQRGLFNT